MNLIHHTLVTLSHAFGPAAQTNPTPLFLVGTFAVANLGLFFFTRGKEFVIGGVASGLFLVPFVQF